MENPNNWAAIADCPDEIQLTVVTRLGGIPVQGIKVNYMGGDKTSTNHLGKSTFDKHSEKIDIVLTYANKDTGMKPETVKVELDCNSYKAKFSHSIPEIRNIKDHICEGETNLEGDSIINFSDEYDVTEAKPENTSDQLIFESYFTVEKGNDDRCIYNINVSLATFSLDVPYINQNYGKVSKITKNGVAKCVIEQWNYEDYLKENEWKGEHSKELKNNPWIGDVLCAPTAATMILMYYGILPNGNEDSTHDVKYANRAWLMEKSFEVALDKDHPWEDVQVMWAIINNILSTNNASNGYKALQLVSALGNAIEGAKFEEQMVTKLQSWRPSMLKALSEGEPLYASIISSHILVVRGVLIGKGGNKLWAICNDPYGYLAVNKSESKDEKDYQAHEAWYYGDFFEVEKQSNPITRKTRNLSHDHNDKCDEKCDTKGMHVYYNQTTLSVDDDKKVCKVFRFRHVTDFRFGEHIDPAIKKKFATEKLIKGK